MKIIPWECSHTVSIMTDHAAGLALQFSRKPIVTSKYRSQRRCALFWVKLNQRGDCKDARRAYHIAHILLLCDTSSDFGVLLSPTNMCTFSLASPFAFGLIEKNVDPARLIDRGGVVAAIAVAVAVAVAGVGAIAIIVMTVIIIIVIVIVVVVVVVVVVAVVVVGEKPFDRGAEVVIVVTNPLSSC